MFFKTYTRHNTAAPRRTYHGSFVTVAGEKMDVYSFYDLCQGQVLLLRTGDGASDYISCDVNTLLGKMLNLTSVEYATVWRTAMAMANIPR